MKEWLAKFQKIEAKSALLITIIISLAPFWRGLFFQADQLMFSIPVFLIGIIWFWRLRHNPEMSKLDWAVVVLSLLYAVSNIVSQNRYQALCWAIQMVALAVIYFIISRELTDKPKIILLVLRIMTFMSSLVALNGLLAYTGLVWGLTDAVLGDRLTATFQYPNTAAAFFNTGMILCLLMAEKVENKWEKALYSGLYSLQVIAFFLCRSRIAFLQLAIILLGFFLLIPWRNKIRVAVIGGLNTIASMLITNILQDLFKKAQEADEIWHAGHGLGIRLHWSATGGEALLWSLIAFAIGVGLYLILDRTLRGFDSREPSRARQRSFTYGVIGLTAVVGLLIVSSIFVPVVSEGMRFVLSPILPTDLINAITNISITDQNLTSRIMFIGNAIGIAKDYPLLGTGGGGYASVYSRYQPIFSTSRFTHSQPFQVLSETGIPGFIAYLSIWGFGTWLAFKILWQSFNAEQDDERHLLLAGLVPAVWAIGAHSTFDFDLTYVAMQMWVYVLFALIAAIAWTGTNRLVIHAPSGGGKASRRTRVPFTSYVVPIIICIMLLPNIPMLISEQIVESITAANDVQKTIDGYEDAINWCNFNSNMMQRYVRIRLELMSQTSDTDQQLAHLQRAYEIADMAVHNDRLNPDTLYYLQRCFYYGGEWNRGIVTAKELADASPFWPSGLELAGATYTRGFLLLTEQNRLGELRSYAEEVASWDGRLAEPTAYQSLAMGMANAILGKAAQAEKHLERAIQEQSTFDLSLMLLVSLYQNQGMPSEASRILSEVGMPNVYERAEYQTMAKWK